VVDDCAGDEQAEERRCLANDAKEEEKRNSFPWGVISESYLSSCQLAGIPGRIVGKGGLTIVWE
jgi:hypothetical protein